MRRLAAISLLILFGSITPHFPAAEREKIEPIDASKGDRVFIAKPIALRISSRVLLSFDIGYERLDCDQTGSCIYEHPRCEAWIVLSQKKDSVGPHIRIVAEVQADAHIASSAYSTSSYINARREFMLRLYGAYGDVLARSHKSCLETAPTNSWSEVNHNGFWKSWRGFAIGPPQE